MALKLYRKGLRIYVSGSETTALQEHLKIRVNNWFFVQKRIDYTNRLRIGQGLAPIPLDARLRFFDARSSSFSAGLWPQVRRWLDANQIEFAWVGGVLSLLGEIQDKGLLKGITLRDDQLWAVNRWLNNDGYGILIAPPGFGKTEAAAAIIKHLNTKTLFVVNNLDLLLQARERLETRLGVKIGCIAGGEWDVTDRQVIVAGIQQLHRMLSNKKHPRHRELLKTLELVKLVVYDEVHHSRSNQTKTLLSHMPNALRRLGMSARPFHQYSADNLSKMPAEDVQVLATMGPVVAKVSASDLVESQDLSRPRIYLVPFESSEIKSWAETRKVYLADNPAITRRIAQQVTAAARAGELSLIIAGNNRKYGLKLYYALQEANINVVYLHGTIDKMRRDWARRQANKGKLEAIVATVIYDEGIDLPDLRQLVLAYGGLSAIKIEQRVGRSLRKKSEGQNVAIVVDFVSYGNKHLRKHSLTRLSQYLEQPHFDVFLVGGPSDHPNSVKRLMGERLRYAALPTEKEFAELKVETGEVGSGVPAVVTIQTRPVPHQLQLFDSADDRGGTGRRRGVR